MCEIPCHAHRKSIAFAYNYNRALSKIVHVENYLYIFPRTRYLFWLYTQRKTSYVQYCIILLLYVLLPYLDIDYEMLPLSVSLWSCQDYWNKSYSTKPRFFVFIGSWLLLRGFDNSWKTRVLSQSAASFNVTQNWKIV